MSFKFSVLLFFLFAFTSTRAQQIRLSEGLGKLTEKLSVRKVFKSLGQPDSIIDKSRPYAKNAPYYAFIYNKYGIKFWYSTNHNNNNYFKSDFWQLHIFPNSTLQIDDHPIQKLDSVGVEKIYGKCLDKAYYKDEILFSYELLKGRKNTMLTFRWKPDGTLKRIEVYCIKYPWR